MSFYEEDDDRCFEYLSKRKRLANGHIMNKNESKLCRKLMAQTGLSENELRQHKKYRVMLSNAQKVPKAKIASYVGKAVRNIIRRIQKETGLTIQHPISKEMLKTEIAEIEKCGIRYYVPKDILLMHLRAYLK